MKIKNICLEALFSLLEEQQLLDKEELQAVHDVAAENFPFAEQVVAEAFVHFHIHVNNIEELPHELLQSHTGKIVNKAEGYIKYEFDDGINFIFSHIPVAQKEKAIRAGDHAYLDHIGIDIRSDEKPAYIVFQQIPSVSAQYDYLFSRQGDGKEAVKCCHMQVKEKYWVYPNNKLNYEFAFGPLVIQEGGAFGVDLRPANPYNKIEETISCCSDSKPKASIFIH